MAYVLTENEKKLVDNISICDYYNSFITPLNPKFRRMIDVPGRGGSSVCPFHDDTDPSFHDWKEKKLFRCFGCGTAGNIIMLHKLTQMKYHQVNMSKEEAMKDLARIYGIELELTEKGEVKVESPFEIARKKLLNPEQYNVSPSKITISMFRGWNNQIMNQKYLEDRKKVSSYMAIDMSLAAFLAQQKEMGTESTEGAN